MLLPKEAEPTLKQRMLDGTKVRYSSSKRLCYLLQQSSRIYCSILHSKTLKVTPSTIDKMNKLIVFDFDGTIADTLRILIKIINRLADEFAYNKIRMHDLHYIKSMRTRDILAYLNIPMLKLPFIIRRIRMEMNKEIPMLKPSVNIKPTLEALNDEGYRIGILTTNASSNVRTFLRNNDLELFDFIRSTHHLLAKHLILKKIKRSYCYHHNSNLSQSMIFYVGDEVRDIEAGKKAGVKTIAVSWGFNSRDALLAESPDYIIDRPEELEYIAKALPIGYR